MSILSQAASRRRFLTTAAAAPAALAAPAIATAAGQTKTWVVQTAWNGGVGLQVFQDWCATIVEKTGGELAFEAKKEGDIAPAFEVYEALRDGKMHAAHNFTIYATKMNPAGAFLSSYPMAMRAPHEFDVFYYGLGGIEMAREIYAPHGVFYVGPVHHGPNIIHAKKPLRYIDDFRGITMRTPGGMVKEFFEALGATTVQLPGSQIFGALQRGEIEAADFVGPSINYDYGFSQETQFISMGPAGYMSVYQPVDIMEISTGTEAWNELSPEMKGFVEQETHAFSDIHHAAIQAADQAAWAKFEADGTRVSRLTAEDVRVMTKVMVPIWFDYAQRSPEATKVFKAQLDYMTSGSLGYVEREVAEIFTGSL
ncbi:MAG: TRAP transporter substrate-binding protein DctP [Pseudomonadota bacterium]